MASLIHRGQQHIPEQCHQITHGVLYKAAACLKTVLPRRFLRQPGVCTDLPVLAVFTLTPGQQGKGVVLLFSVCGLSLAELS